jgi:hypothetical protein
MRHVLVAIILLGFGAIKLPLERRLAQEHRAAFFHGEKLNLDLRQQIGQLGFIAALSGFRAVVADLLWIQAHAAWERTEWGKMALILENVTALQPRNVMFWDLAGWHMAWNASAAAIQDKTQPREALRIKAQREYFQLGRDFLERGIANNPDKYVLYERLGLLLREKFNDHCGASEAYQKASQFPDAPEYLKRFTVYEMSYCPGREREAYERLLKLYNEGDRERLPTLLNRLRALQEKLNIPPEERVSLPPEKKP